MKGAIVSAHGKRFGVEDAHGAHFECVIRGKRGGVACNDAVEFKTIGTGAGVIESIMPRRNLLYRSDEMRSKLIAANCDQVVLVTAAVPTPRPELIDRCLIAAGAAGIPAIIVVNKADLPETPTYRASLSPYADMGYPVLCLSALGEISALRPCLASKTSVLVGASGTGKSTLLNALIPGIEAEIGAISTALDAGRHTTTHTRRHALPGGGYLIDSPGMQVFGLAHVRAEDLSRLFPEFAPYLGQCRFHNCRHLQEPGCAVLAGLEAGKINTARWRLYRNLRIEHGAAERRHP